MINKINIKDYGWNKHFEEKFAAANIKNTIPARVSVQYARTVKVLSNEGETKAIFSGRIRHNAKSRQDYPVVGDWVCLKLVPGSSKAFVQELLPRKTALVRKSAGAATSIQVIAANIDTVFIVSSLDNNFNVRRIERYLALVYESGANPIIILNKADICNDIDSKLEELKPITADIPVHATSIKQENGLDCITQHISPGHTIALVGSSGVGKSSIINKLYGEDILKVQAVRESDSKGMHTTTRRELIIMPNKGILIDTPGMRELQLWGSGAGVNDSFEDIDGYSQECRFADCAHQKEPGCAVKAALDKGTLLQERYESYLSLINELKALKVKQNENEWKNKGNFKK